jgi:Right handed beta helix region
VCVHVCVVYTLISKPTPTHLSLANPTIQHCHIHNCGGAASHSSTFVTTTPSSAVLFLQESEGVLQHCQVEECAGYGVRVRARASPMLVQNCVRHCAHSGVYFGAHSAGFAIENRVYTCARAGMEVRSAARPTLRGNHVFACDSGAVVVCGPHATPLLERNRLCGAPALRFGPRTLGVARHNRLAAEQRQRRPTARSPPTTTVPSPPSAVVLCERGAAPLLEHNRIVAAGQHALAVQLCRGAAPQLRHNVIRGRIHQAKRRRRRAHARAQRERAMGERAMGTGAKGEGEGERPHGVAVFECNRRE